jgi:Cu2+-containing amine oxidase
MALSQMKFPVSDVSRGRELFFKTQVHPVSHSGAYFKRLLAHVASQYPPSRAAEPHMQNFLIAPLSISWSSWPLHLPVSVIGIQGLPHSSAAAVASAMQI